MSFFTGPPEEPFDQTVANVLARFALLRRSPESFGQAWVLQVNTDNTSLIFLMSEAFAAWRGLCESIITRYDGTRVIAGKTTLNPGLIRNTM